MEEKINIAAILNDKPNDIRLYSPIFGECTFCCVREDTNDICVKKHNGVKEFFDSKGLYYNTGEVMLFPSKEMRDWAKFSWKKGDVLQNNDHSTQVIFDRFISDTYQMISCKYWLKINNGNERFVIETNVFTKEYFKVNEETRQCYINEIENRLCGKLNLETLEIEKAQPEFKDGDIVALVVRKCTHIAIFQSRQEAYIGFHAVLCQNDELLLEEPFREDVGDIELRLATDSEKKQLFSALEKKGKAWDAEKKMIVDLKTLQKFKPFDKVIIRLGDHDTWKADFYSHYCTNGEAYTVGGVHISDPRYILPYEGNESLLGTTDNSK